MNKTAEDHIQKAQEMIDKRRKEADDFLDKNREDTEKMEMKSMENFSSWRDYLHRYYLVILAIVGGTGILNLSAKIDDFYLSLGIGLALGGIFFGFFAINLYFYFERKWIQINSFIDMVNPHKMYDHPDVKNDLVMALRLNLKKGIKENKLKLKEEKDKKERRYLKRTLRGDKAFFNSAKYIGSQFGFMETIWVAGVVLSLVLTFVGMVMIFIVII